MGNKYLQSCVLLMISEVYFSFFEKGKDDLFSTPSVPFYKACSVASEAFSVAEVAVLAFAASSETEAAVVVAFAAATMASATAVGSGGGGFLTSWRCMQAVCSPGEVCAGGART